MDDSKIDAYLALELDGAQGDTVFDVFVEGSPQDAKLKEPRRLQLGLPESASSRNLFTASLSARQISELSDEPWVISIQGSPRARPLARAL
jgi:hypothetical protein